MRLFGQRLTSRLVAPRMGRVSRNPLDADAPEPVAAVAPRMGRVSRNLPITVLRRLSGVVAPRMGRVSRNLPQCLGADDSRLSRPAWGV